MASLPKMAAEGGRWRSPPSWILSICHVGQICRVIRHGCFFPIKLGENRSIGSKVIECWLFKRWQLPPSWISFKLIIYLKLFFNKYVTDAPSSSNMSNMMTIGWTVQQCYSFLSIYEMVYAWSPPYLEVVTIILDFVLHTVKVLYLTHFSNNSSPMHASLPSNRLRGLKL